MMTTNRYEEGLKYLQAIDGSAGETVIASLETIAPDLGKWIIEFAFGEIYSRASLSLKEREMLTLASLLTQGDTENQLIVHIHGALHVGLTQEDIIETFLHCVPYVGFPKVLNAVAVAKKVFSDHS